MGLTDAYWQKFAAFHVHVAGTPPWRSFVEQYEDQEQDRYESADSLKRRLNRVEMTCAFELVYTDATVKAELRALNMLTTTTSHLVSPRSKLTFEYLLSFKEPGYELNLLDEIPHMADPLGKPRNGLQKRLVEMFDEFDKDQ